MQFANSILFVPKVADAVAFYERAFGLERGRVTPAFATMKTGQTVLAFGAEDNERRELGGAVNFRENRRDSDSAGVQISFVADDPQAAYSRAIAAGALEVYAPRLMPWGQWVGRVRDIHGVLVSIVSAPKF
jgi:lactoylglutathione lyase